MKMAKWIVIVLCLSVVFIAADKGYCVEKDKQVSQEELIANIKDKVDQEEEVLNMVPDMKQEKGSDGKISYTFKGKKLEDLSKDELTSLSTRVNQAAVKVRTDRIQRQIENLRQIQNAQRIAAQRLPPAPPPNARATTPPTPPKNYTPPPAPPKTR